MTTARYVDLAGSGLGGGSKPTPRPKFSVTSVWGSSSTSGGLNPPPHPTPHQIERCAWVGSTNVTDVRQTDRQTDDRLTDDDILRSRSLKIHTVRNKCKREKNKTEKNKTSLTQKYTSSIQSMTVGPIWSCSGTPLPWRLWTDYLFFYLFWLELLVTFCSPEVY